MRITLNTAVYIVLLLEYDGEISVNFLDVISMECNQNSEQNFNNLG